MELIEIRSLNFTYPGQKERCLKDISVSVERGSFTLLCGCSGSGKTTLLRHLKPVLTPHGERSGSILYDGKPLDSLSLRDQSGRIGYVMQDPDDQIVTDKVWHELAFGLESLGCGQKEMRLRVAEMASYFGMQELFHRDTATLSGGQKQMLNLASVMAMQPEVLILDEPTAQLDPIAAADFLNTVRAINRDLGMTVILSEHRLEEIYYSANRVIVMENGAVITNKEPSGAAARLYALGSPMALALPTPVRVWQGLGESEAACPLTVREGRSRLSERAASLKDPGLPCGESFDEEDVEDPALELDEVRCRYSKEGPDVLRGVSLRLPKGKLCAVAGANGAGKSTLLKAVCGICPPWSGKIRLYGKNIKDYKHGALFNNMLTMLPQDPKNIFAKKTVREELEEMAANIRDVTELCHIGPLLDRHPYDLSGGEQQRCALAKVLLTDPRVLLLDEPTKGFDGFFKQEFASILKELTGRGVTVLMASHDLEFCASCADIVSLFFDGQILTTETPRRFFAHNCFYTTAAVRMSRGILQNTVTVEDVIEACMGGKNEP